MSDLITSTLEIVAPHLRGALVDQATWPKVRWAASAMARCYPLRMGFECRLDAHDPTVDVQQCFNAEAGEPEGLAQYATAMLECAEAADREAWRRIEALAVNWQDRASPLQALMNEVWLEFDQCNDDQPALTPSVFVGLDPVKITARNSLAAAEEALQILVGTAWPTGLRENLERCALAGGDEAYVEHLGVMLSRRTDLIRVNINGLPMDQAEDYLRTVGWPGDFDALMPKLTWLSAFSDGVKLCLDVGERIAPNIGLECFNVSSPDLHSRWKLLLESLVARGVCSPEKKSALLLWPGLCEPANTTTDWPDELIARSLLLPPEQFSVLSRELTHVKVTLATTGRVQAKAYFGHYYAWLVPEVPNPSSQEASEPRHPVSASVAPVRLLDDAMERALNYLLRARKPTGWWYDYENMGIEGASDVWTSAYVAYRLTAIDDVRARRAADWIGQLILLRGGESGGWGWNDHVLPDSDSTLWGILLANSLGYGDHHRVQAARKFLNQHRLPNHGIVCYTEENYLQFVRTHLVPVGIQGWFEEAICITAATSLLPDYSEGARARLRTEQHKDGHWDAHWWPDVEYSTMLAVLGMTRVKDPADRDSIAAALHWAAARISDNGAVVTSQHVEGSPFATACTLWILLQADDFEDVRQLVERSIAWLLAEQHHFGCWRPSATVYARQPKLQFLKDARSVFTTATVLSALQEFRSRA